MVKVREDYPVTEDGQIDLSCWLERINSRAELQDPEVLRQACLFAKKQTKFMSVSICGVLAPVAI